MALKTVHQSPARLADILLAALQTDNSIYQIVTLATDINFSSITPFRNCALKSCQFLFICGQYLYLAGFEHTFVFVAFALSNLLGRDAQTSKSLGFFGLR